MDWIIGVAVSIATWLVDRDKLFSGMPLWGQGWAIRQLARAEPERVVERARELFDEELRLAVARSTLEDPGAWDRNLSILLQQRRIDSSTKDTMHKLRYGSRSCNTTREALEYWYKMKPLLRKLKTTPRRTP